MIVNQNCWDFKKCDRGPGGSKVAGSEVCPAATETSCTGLNNGNNGGRMCWAVAGTFSKGRVTGAFARELSCLNCDFLRSVCKEEGICDIELLTPYRLYHDRSLMFGRREFMRIDVHFEITIKPPKDVSDIIGVTIDFSLEGFSFVSENIDLKPKDPVEFRIKHPDKNQFAHVLGDVTWKRQVRDRCLAGMKIRFMEKEIKSKILDYTYDRWITGVQFH